MGIGISFHDACFPCIPEVGDRRNSNDGSGPVEGKWALDGAVVSLAEEIVDLSQMLPTRQFNELEEFRNVQEIESETLAHVSTSTDLALSENVARLFALHDSEQQPLPPLLNVIPIEGGNTRLQSFDERTELKEGSAPVTTGASNRGRSSVESSNRKSSRELEWHKVFTRFDSENRGFLLLTHLEVELRRDPSAARRLGLPTNATLGAPSSNSSIRKLLSLQEADTEIDWNGFRAALEMRDRRKRALLAARK
mmetsp:Transcript_28243/g.57853  ORF Transcript_28243/g.57853 Transcript_28243/m.57853 type:complete len:252 (-) Transcript_28243:300-1055(-)